VHNVKCPNWLGLSVRQQDAIIHIHHRHLLLLLSPKADTHFTVPRRVEGWTEVWGICAHTILVRCLHCFDAIGWVPGGNATCSFTGNQISNWYEVFSLLFAVNYHLVSFITTAYHYEGNKQKLRRCHLFWSILYGGSKNSNRLCCKDLKTHELWSERVVFIVNKPVVVVDPQGLWRCTYQHELL